MNACTQGGNGELKTADQLRTVTAWLIAAHHEKSAV